MPIPKVTVVIPNYNHQRYLEKRIQSVLDQTYQNFEVLYLDDASTDRSDLVFAKFKDDPRVRSILNTQNSGTPFIQWNRGVREARGEYVWIAEADDYADPHLLETLVAILDAHPNVGTAYCLSWMVDKNDEVLIQIPKASYENDAAKYQQIKTDAQRKQFDPSAIPNLENWETESWDHDFVADGRQFYRHFMLYENKVPNASATVFRKSVYQAAGGAEEDMRVCGDYMAWIRLLKQADVAYTSEPLNYFRTHQTSVRSTTNKTGLWALERYRVASFIIGDLALTPDEADRLCHIRLSNWLEDLFSPTRRVDARRAWQILGIARRMDPKFWRRLAWQCGYYFLHRTPLYHAARRWGRRLLWQARAKL